MSSALVVDAHHHLWDLTTGRHDWLDAPALTPIRRSYGLPELREQTSRAGIGRTVAVQALPEAGETRELLAVAAASQGLVAGVVGWVDLTAPDVADQLAALRAAPGGALLVSVRHPAQDEPDDGWLARPDVRRGIVAVGAAGLAVDLLVRPPQWSAALQLAGSLPDVPLVLDHAGKPPLAAGHLTAWRSWILAMGGRGNTAVKLSGLVTEADWDNWTVGQLRPVAEMLLDAFGAARVLAGSDWPVCELAAGYAEVWSSVRELLDGASSAERAAVLGGTATSVYRLAAARE